MALVSGKPLIRNYNNKPKEKDKLHILAACNIATQAQVHNVRCLEAVKESNGVVYIKTSIVSWSQSHSFELNLASLLKLIEAMSCVVE